MTLVPFNGAAVLLQAPSVRVSTATLCRKLILANGIHHLVLPTFHNRRWGFGHVSGQLKANFSDKLNFYYSPVQFLLYCWHCNSLSVSVMLHCTHACEQNLKILLHLHLQKLTSKPKRAFKHDPAEIHGLGLEHKNFNFTLRLSLYCRKECGWAFSVALWILAYCPSKYGVPEQQLRATRCLNNWVLSLNYFTGTMAAKVNWLYKNIEHHYSHSKAKLSQMAIRKDQPYLLQSPCSLPTSISSMQWQSNPQLNLPRGALSCHF